jgi:SAM-dependent methyltransferase
LNRNQGLSLLEAPYRDLLPRFESEEAPEYGSLVTPNGNATAPYHRWFHLKEGYSSAILLQISKDTNLRPDSLRIFDPFCGSGTTLLAASGANFGGRNVRAVGMEVNPFLYFVCKTKIDAITNRPPDLREMYHSIKSANLALSYDNIPKLHAFNQPDYFPGTGLRDLLQLRDHIEDSQFSETAKAIGLLAVAASVEAVSNLRRDGRALRYVPEKARVGARRSVLARLTQMIDDVECEEHCGHVSVHSGDSRMVTRSIVADNSIDLVACSPPYPNNIDYTEIYKMEAWLLGMYSDADAMKQQRLRTVRSHSSIQFASESLDSDLMNLIEPVIAAVPKDAYLMQRRAMIRGYVSDLADVFDQLKRVVRRGGRVAMVVGNSLHGRQGSWLVATDLLVAAISEQRGFTCDRILIARRPRRRSTAEPLLRESVVLLRRR